METCQKKCCCNDRRSQGQTFRRSFLFLGYFRFLVLFLRDISYSLGSNYFGIIWTIRGLTFPVL